MPDWLFAFLLMQILMTALFGVAFYAYSRSYTYRAAKEEEKFSVWAMILLSIFWEVTLCCLIWTLMSIDEATSRGDER